MEDEGMSMAAKRKILFSHILDIIQISGLFDEAEYDCNSYGNDECFKIWAVKFGRKVE